MSKLGIRDADALLKESASVAAAASAGGLAMALLSPLPLATAALSAALFGGTIGAAWTRGPFGKAMKAVVGLVGGTVTALGFTALVTRFGLGDAGFLFGGALGGLALGALLSVDGGSRMSQASGAVLGAGLGLVGAEATMRIASFAESTSAPTAVSSTVIAGLFGLWVAAGSGLRRLERQDDPLRVRAQKLARAVAESLRTRILDALRVYDEVEQTLVASDQVGPATASETREHAQSLFRALLDTADNVHRLDRDLGAARPDDVERRLAELQQKSDATSDAVTLGHLARATQALRAQKSALDGLRVGRDRADAALDAQSALLERLRLAVAQYQASDRERFQLELSAVAEQVARLSDDLDSLSSAIAEAEAFQDRRILADVEKAGRRALVALERQHDESAAVEVESARRG